MTILTFFYNLIRVYFNKVYIKKINQTYIYPNFLSHRTNNTTMYSWEHQIKKSLFLSNKIRSFVFKGNNFISLDRFLMTLKISDYDSLNPSKFQIENIIYIDHGYSTVRKNYSLKTTYNCDNLNFIYSEQDKIICAKYLLMIMNEISVDEINIYNYNNLVKYINKKSNVVLGKNVKNFYPKGWQI